MSVNSTSASAIYDVTSCPYMTSGESGGSSNGTNTTNDFLFIIYYLIGILGLCGNLLVVVVVFSTSMKNEIANMYIASQSVFDTLVAITIILQPEIQAETNRVISDSAVGIMYCRLWLTKFPMWMFIECSSWNLVALTFERYMGIVYPIKHKLFWNGQKVLTSVMVICCSSIVVQGSYTFWSSGVENGKCMRLYYWSGRTLKNAIGICMSLYNFLLPFMSIIVLYTCMYRSLRTRVKPSDASSAPQAGSLPHTDGKQSSNRDDKMERALRNLLNTLLIVVICFFLCWVCNQVFFILLSFGYMIASLQSPFYHFSVVAVFCNCCCNPIIYMIKYKKFQVGIAKLFNRGRRALGLQQSVTSSA